jgi:hypothetical protein
LMEQVVAGEALTILETFNSPLASDDRDECDSSLRGGDCGDLRPWGIVTIGLIPNRVES